MTLDEAIEIINQFRDRQGNSIDDIEAFDMAIKALEQTPPKGKWIEEEDCLDGINFPDVRFYCSECKAMAYRKSIYCPNCGAKMYIDLEGEKKKSLSW